MNSPKFYSVITTIQSPTPAVRGLCRTLRRVPGPLLVLGDRKGPREYRLDGAELFALDRQLELPLRLPRLLPGQPLHPKEHRLSRGDQPGRGVHL